MNNRVNYTLVGMLVLTGFVLMLGFTFWMIKPSSETKTKIYTIYFDESVLGLNIDAPVKYRGISVGKVTRLTINPKNSEQVEIQVTILLTTPIKESTVARLTAQGITGLTYINLTLGENNAPELVLKKGEKYPVIKTVPSFLENIEQSMVSVTGKFSNTLTGTQKLLNDDNQREIANALKNLASVSAKMDRLLDDKTIRHLQETTANLDSLTYNMNSVTRKMDLLLPNVDVLINKSLSWQDEIAGSFGSIMNSYLGIRSSMDEIKRAVSSGEFNVKEITSDVVPTMNNTFLELQSFIIKLDGVLEQYKRSPSDFLYKETQLKKAPGEKK